MCARAAHHHNHPVPTDEHAGARVSVAKPPCPVRPVQAAYKPPQQGHSGRHRESLIGADILDCSVPIGMLGITAKAVIDEELLVLHIA